MLDGGEHVLQLAVRIGRADEEQLVVGLDRLLRTRRVDLAVADDGHQRAVLRPGDESHRLADVRRVLGQRELDEVGVTLPEAFSLAPEIPPVSAVLPGYGFSFWFGMAAPAGTPAPVIARANAALNKVLQLPELGERLARLGYAPRGSEPAYFHAFLREQIETLTARAKEAGLEPG